MEQRDVRKPQEAQALDSLEDLVTVHGHVGQDGKAGIDVRHHARGLARACGLGRALALALGAFAGDRRRCCCCRPSCQGWRGPLLFLLPFKGVGCVTLEEGVHLHRQVIRHRDDGGGRGVQGVDVCLVPTDAVQLLCRVHVPHANGLGVG